MSELLDRLVRQIESVWLMLAGLLVAALVAIDQYLYRRYSRRLADSAKWTDAQRERIDQLQSRIEDLEARAERAEAHAEHCEEVLEKVTHKIAEDSDVEWHPEGTDAL